MPNFALYAFALLLLAAAGTAQTVRLVDGGSPREGRLEVYHNDTWGTVCHDGFTDAAARVVCYMLGYGYVGQAIGRRYDGGSGQIWLDDVQCSGTETRIADCRHRGWGSHNCEHYEDVSVSCITVRLVRGSSPMEGLLEVDHNGTWGTVCRNSFTQAAAKVVCYMRGYEDAGQYIGNRYGAGRGPIWLDGVQCSGTETNIADCEHRGWGNHSCRHDEDVSVSCFSEVRLVGGNSSSKGRLEVYHNGTWGTVCDEGFTDAAARVVCYSLGHGRIGRFTGNNYGAGSWQIWLDNLRCNGAESHITQCSHNGWGRHNCSHSDVVSISCVADSAEAVALVGGGNPRVGRLEVFHANQWGTVCDDGFTDAAARVVCYSLGFGYVGRKVDISCYDVGHGWIWLNNIKCNGTEQHIGECSHDDWGVNSCTHHEDVAVSCSDDTPPDNMNDSTTSVTPVRLAGGSRSRGRLEVLHDGDWGTVCGDDDRYYDDYYDYYYGYYNYYYYVTVAHVICKMLGLESGRKIDNNNYRTDHGPVWLDNVRCSGRERDIAECSHNGWGVHDCDHHEDVSVSCFHVDVRLNGGRDPREGRLEVFYDGVWAKVCGRLNYATVLVVCNMLGFGYIGRPAWTWPTHVIAAYNQYRPSDDHQMDLGLVLCTGTEETIAECNKSRIGYCQHGGDAVSCLSWNAVALFGGGSRSAGRLEVYHNGIWGTVCNNGFTDAAARVVCYSLGFGYVGQEMNISTYGVANGIIWLKDIQCEGTERHIGDCSHSGWLVHDCTHNEDVAVSCVGDTSATSAALVTSPSSDVGSTTSMSSPGLTTASTSSQSSTMSTSSQTSTVSSTMVTSSPTSSTTSSSSPSSTVSSTTSIRSNNNQDVAVTSNSGLISAVAAVGGLVLIFGIVVICTNVIIAHKFSRIEEQIRQKPPKQRTDAAMIPMHVVASTDIHNIDDDDDDEVTNNINASSDFQQSPSPVAGAVGGIGTADISYEPFARYESMLNDEGCRSQVQPEYKTFKATRPTF